MINHWLSRAKASLYSRSQGTTRVGKEAVQLYLRDPVASVVRPVQQLIDYRKIALEAGERKDVTFVIREEQLRFWDFDCRLVSEAGEFRVSTGYADHLILTESFWLKK